jgi:peptide/nickel transport system permease protein
VIRYALHRLAGLVGVLLVVSVIVWFGGRAFAPGNIAQVIIGSEGATRAQYEQIASRLGLNKPLVVQYLDWLFHALQGNFGTSPISQRSVTSIVGAQLPVSLELALFALLISTVIGVPVGVLVAVHARRAWSAGVRGLFLVLFSVPTFVSGVILLLLAALYLHPLYAVTYVPLTASFAGNLRCMLLPAMSIGIPVSAVVMQLTRNTMIEALAEPHIAMARAKGVSERSIRYLHALKNSLPPILALQGYTFGLLLGGLIVVEDIFNLPGLGGGILNAINDRDYALLTAQVMVLATAFVVANTIADVLQPLLDPRRAQR